MWYEEDFNGHDIFRFIEPIMYVKVVTMKKKTEVMMIQIFHENVIYVK